MAFLPEGQACSARYAVNEKPRGNRQFCQTKRTGISDNPDPRILSALSRVSGVENPGDAFLNGLH